MVGCVVPITDDNTCRDGGENSIAKSAVTTVDGGGDDVEDQDKDCNNELRETKAEGVGGKRDDRFA